MLGDVADGVTEETIVVCAVPLLLVLVKIELPDTFITDVDVAEAELNDVPTPIASDVDPIFDDETTWIKAGFPIIEA